MSGQAFYLVLANRTKVHERRVYLSQFLIASLPRSGNHLLRFIIEYVTGRETLGIRHNPEDLPLHCSAYPAAPDVLGHVAGPAVGRKVHYANEIAVEFAIDTFGQAIVIYRQVLEAALSHLTKGREFQAWREQKGWRKLKAYRKLMMACVSYMIKQFRFYGAIRRLSIPVTFIAYENLVSDAAAAYLPELQKLQLALGSRADAGRLRHLQENFPKIRQISAGRRGGAWGGINSDARADYYRNKSQLALLVPLALLSIPVKIAQCAALRSSQRRS